VTGSAADDSQVASLGRLVRHARAAKRLRLEVPRLFGDELLARRLEQAVARQEGVRSVTANPRSGRILITYAEHAPVLDRLEELAAPADPRPARPRVQVPPRDDGAVAFHALETREALRTLDSSAEGLAPAEAARRLRAHGPNVLDGPAREPWYRVLGRQLVNLPTGLLLGSAAISLLLGDALEAGAIVLVLGLNAGIGFEVERRSEALLASWQRLEAGHVKVVRAGGVHVVPAGDLVPGDVLICEAGDVLAADARVLESDRLACDEAPLTGESEAQLKAPPPVRDSAPLAERTSMVHAGTAVVSGRGRALVTATGWTTELARVRALLEVSRAPKAPLEVRLGELTNRASYISLAAAGVAAVAGIARGRPVLAMLRNAVALGVAAIPEGLPLISTATLVRSMGRLRGEGVVVRRISSAETLGGVTVVCADKTGTLTRNQMKLELVDLPGRTVPAAELRAAAGDPLDDPQTLALAAAVLNSEVDVRRHHGTVTLLGSSTERALVEAALAAGLDVTALRRAFPRRMLRERHEAIHYVTSLHDAPGGGRVAFIKGAPEQVLDLCADDGGRPLAEDVRARLLQRNEALASDGLRVLAVAWRRLGADADDVPARAHRFLALLALRDPLRETAAASVERAQRAGIRTVILTGDQSATAAAIARRLGLTGEVVEGAELPRLLADGPGDGHARLRGVGVFSRVTPADKLAIVRALRASGEVVAMAGDGVNDAPALKAADVGIAVGRASTDLARQTADVVLDGEDLESIVTAIGEGRVVQDNLQRTVRFLFATNLSEVALMLGASLIGAEPLSALQLLWINLLTDTLPALALALAPGDPAVLARPPVATGASFLTGRGWRQVMRDGLLLATAGGAAHALGGPAMTFAALPAAQLGYALTCRAAPARGAPPPSDAGRFTALVGGSLALHALASTVPALRALLRLPAAAPLPLLGLAAFGLPALVAYARRAARVPFARPETP